MEEIYFSILVPVYNAKKYLRYCLESVLNQKYKNYEIILINDGSTDSSGDICSEFSKKDKRIRVFHQKNMGIAKTRYETLKKIKGEFIIFLDSDDHLEPDSLQKIAKNIKDYQADIIMFNYKNIDEKNNFISNNKTLFNHNEIFTTDKSKIYNMIFFTDDLNNLWTKAINSSLIKLDDYSDYLEMNNGEDNMFLIPLLIRAKKIVNINDYFYNYRDNSKGITSTFKKSKIDDEFMRYNYTLEHLKKLNINNFENLKKLDIFFFKKIIILILQAMCSNNSFKEKLNIINNIRCSNEIENIFQKVNINHFKNSSKNLYYLYKFKLYGFIFVYSNLYSLINKAKQKRYIRQYSKSKILTN